MRTFFRSIVSAICSWLKLSPSRALQGTRDERTEHPSEQSFQQEEIGQTRPGSDNAMRQNREENARHDKVPRNVDDELRVKPETESFGTPQEHLDVVSPESAAAKFKGPHQKANHPRPRSKDDERTRVDETADAQQKGQQKPHAADDENAQCQDPEHDQPTTENEGHHDTEEVKPGARTDPEHQETSHDEIHLSSKAAADSEPADTQEVESDGRGRSATEEHSAPEHPVRLKPEGKGASSSPPNVQVQTTKAEEHVGDRKHRDSTGESAKGVQRERPSKYRPPSGASPSSPQKRSTSSTNSSMTGNAKGRRRPADIELRILFKRGGYCCVSLLPKRPSPLPEKIRVSGPDGPIDLVALEENWYQDTGTDKLGRQLQTGIRWIHEPTVQEWVLSGREVFVLSPGVTHRGFVSTARLVLERKQAVICTTTILSTVEKVLREAGCTDWIQLGPDEGAPEGWFILSGVVPLRSVPLTDDADILNVLRPLPEIQINLEGGIRLRYNEWLAGHPPSIHVYGDPEHSLRVEIDGIEAELSATGCYTAPNWDTDGNHRVWCDGTTTTYSLVRSQINTEAWPAYSFAKSTDRTQIGICGPLVQSYAFDGPENQSARSNIVQVPASNPVLLGQFPWEVSVSVPRTDLVGVPCIASPPFAPIWAVPLQPLRCRKSINRVLLVGEPVEPGWSRLPHDHGSNRDAERLWCSSILDAGRKGLAVRSDNTRAQELWNRYKARARYLWKVRRRRK